MDAETSMTRVTLGRSRVRESRTPGSVRAKAEWLSYSATTSRPRNRDPNNAILSRAGERLVIGPAGEGLSLESA